MKKGLMKGIGLLVICVLTLTGCTPFGSDVSLGGGTSYKPVIYLYPEETTEVSVQLDFNGTLTCIYPAYENGWTSRWRLSSRSFPVRSGLGLPW